MRNITSRTRDHRQNPPLYPLGFEIELDAHSLDPREQNPDLAAGRALRCSHCWIVARGSGIGGCNRGEFDADGFRVYLDHRHPEISSPLVSSARDLVLVFRQVRTLVRRLHRLARSLIGPLAVGYNNTSRSGTAWGFHMNLFTHRKAFDRWRDSEWKELFHTWVPFLITFLPLSGKGKVGSENGKKPCPYQISERADYVDYEVELETVERKSLVNTRDEALADPDRFARFHVTFSETCLAEFSNFLKFLTHQVLIALLSEGYPLPRVRLKEPLEALGIVSRDLEFRRCFELDDGRKIRALDIQRILAEAVIESIDRGSAAAAIPHARRGCELWIEALDQLESGHPALARRLDWVAKRDFIARVAATPGCSARRLQVADLFFAGLDGVFERLDAEGAFDRLEDFLPGDSVFPARLLPREWARTALVSRFRRHFVRVDWNGIVVRDPDHPRRLWIIKFVDPRAADGVPELVSDARDWSHCLDRLRARGFVEEFDGEESVLRLPEYQSVEPSRKGGIEA